MPATCVPQYVPRANTGLSKHGDPVFPHFWSSNQNLARVCAKGGGVTRLFCSCSCSCLLDVAQELRGSLAGGGGTYPLTHRVSKILGNSCGEPCSLLALDMRIVGGVGGCLTKFDAAIQAGALATATAAPLGEGGGDLRDLACGISPSHSQVAAITVIQLITGVIAMQ